MDGVRAGLDEYISPAFVDEAPRTAGSPSAIPASDGPSPGRLIAPIRGYIFLPLFFGDVISRLNNMSIYCMLSRMLSAGCYD